MKITKLRIVDSLHVCSQVSSCFYVTSTTIIRIADIAQFYMRSITIFINVEILWFSGVPSTVISVRGFSVVIACERYRNSNANALRSASGEDLFRECS